MNKFYFTFLFLFMGCVNHTPLKMPNIENPKAFIKPNNSIETHNITDFIVADDDLNLVPDTQIEIVLTEPITMNTLFSILITQGVSVIGNFDISDKISIPNYKGSLKNFLKIIQNSHGLFFKYENGTLTVKSTTPVYVKVLMPGIEDKLQNLIKSFGVENSYYDQLSSRIIFQSDYFTYKTIRDYFYNNPYLTLIIFDVMILEHEESKDNENGFDWSALSLNLNELSKLPGSLSLTSSESGNNISVGFRSLSLQSVYRSLSKHEKFNVLQSARISTLNGYECTLDVSEKIPYVSKINLGSLNDNSGSVVQGFEFSSAVSGLVLKLKPIVSENLISILFKSKIQSLVKFLEVGSANQTVQQPILSTRNIENQIVVNPGVTTLIGGLRYEKGSFAYKSLSFLKAGLGLNETRNFSISVLLRCELIRYVFKKKGVI